MATRFFSPRRHSGAGPPAWMQVVEPRRERRPRNPVVLIIHSRKAGMTNGRLKRAGKNHNSFHIPPPPSWIPAYAGRLRASMPSRRIQDFLSINDEGEWSLHEAHANQFTPHLLASTIANSPPCRPSRGGLAAYIRACK